MELDRRPQQDTARLTPRERLQRFAALQRRARQLLAASREGYRQYRVRNLRHAAFMLSSDDPLNVFQLLARAGVPFVIIGGHAVVFHGYLRTTEDADLHFRALRGLGGCLAGDSRIHPRLLDQR